MDSILAAVNYKDKDLIEKVRDAANKKFSGNSYVKNLWILKEYKKRGGKVGYKGKKPSDKSIKKQTEGASIDEEIFNLIDEFEESDAAKNEGKTLNKPFRLPSGSNKKFGVYVKNDKGNVIMVKFGDPNMEIKRDSPERRKNFRARHNCDQAKDKTKAGYWSCRMWSKKPVSKVVGSCLEVNQESEIDIQNLSTQEEILLICPSFSNAEESED
jgi:hypothetical protein